MNNFQFDKFWRKPVRAVILMLAFLSLGGGIFYIFAGTSKPTIAQICPSCPACAPLIKICDVNNCVCQSNHETPITIKHITDEFIKHREWLIKILWEAHVLPAMMLMTEQISTLMVHQMLIIGAFFDAKHQLETQRLLQEMQAQAHKDYQPSYGMCELGTNMRSLAASDRNMDLTQIGLAARTVQRQMLSADGISSGSARDDYRSRLAQLKSTYCDRVDFGNGMSEFCQGTDPARLNMDINYTNRIDSDNTLMIDFVDAEVSDDEEDVLALSANLYGPQILPRIPEDKMADEQGNIIEAGAFAYMKTRSLAAKRSVAMASYAAQAAMRARGENEVRQYMEAILKEMGLQDEEIIRLIDEERPSYYAQMNILTKKLYQSPSFYANLYDKPVNVERKDVAMMAIDMIQRRDMYRSQQRAEAIMAIWLETRLGKEESDAVNEINRLMGGGRP